MFASRRVRILIAAAMLTAAGLTWSLLPAQVGQGGAFDGSEHVDKVTVRIDLAAGGEDLSEPVLLDLGLGFPLWLFPVGRTEGETLPFGAVPQAASTSHTLKAGQSATFTFDLHADAGLDRLRTTGQFLEGVQISDISRIGFASEGATKWELAGYEIQINGRVFAADAAVHLAVQAAHEAARLRQAELAVTSAARESEANDLQALVDAGLATAADVVRLNELNSALAPLADERRRLAAQLEGLYPWFEEPGFVSVWQSGTPVDSARVTLITASHPGADTDNLVYFRTGGHKYLLGSPSNPLRAEAGPQSFDLDMVAGPLTAADLRGYAVGMLAHPGLQGPVPDRWHPQRLLVEIDGRVVYDSEESPLDRLSLAAVRVIPPAQIGADGSAVFNAPIARETFVWQAGSGAGLDLEHGGVAALPDEGDPTFPHPEAGLPPGLDSDLGYLDILPFPGEYGPGWGPLWGPDLGWWPGPVPPPPWVGVLGWLDWLLGPLFPDWLAPVGPPFQVENVHITSGWRYGDVFHVEWDIAGDEGHVDHYVVQLLPVHPHADPFIIGAPMAVGVAAVGARSLDLALGVVDDPTRFVWPVVTAIATDPLIPPDWGDGPVRPLFRPGMSALGQPAPLAAFEYEIGGATFWDPVTLGASPPPAGRAVWFFAGQPGHIDLVFGDPAPGYNVGLRPVVGDDSMSLPFTGDVIGTNRIVAHGGFLGGPDATNAATFKMSGLLVPLIPGPPVPFGPVSVGVANVGGAPPSPMGLLEQVIDTAVVGGGPATLVVWFTVDGGTADFDHPPAFFGIRVMPE